MFGVCISFSIFSLQQLAELLKLEESQKEMKQKVDSEFKEISHKYEQQLQEEKKPSMKNELERKLLEKQERRGFRLATLP
ncbi:hypothetical protein PHYPO_G00038120 [Pangasianodon hypophthalmus]|uniref:Uncharacterized protein n=1 Tax=Pangasianodon hypophthalmus TaxID=310915 RepID=A0A5N5MLF2_PANHP|nr:hypothetical protein PHYPO_G00038120 [Pangasianodon hypophthalmus]